VRARCRHHQRQAFHVLRMVGGQRLSDHAAHRHATDMRAFNAERIIGHADGVARHVVDRIGCIRDR
jgi:hypothetical protein